MSKCPEPVFYRFTWPGRNENFICMAHGEKVREVAYAMGFFIQLIPIYDGDLSAEKSCCQELEAK
jgi:hypothetical protein